MSSKSLCRRRRTRCRRAWCSVKDLLMSLKSTQNPVNTEHSATSFPCGRRDCPAALRALPKYRAIRGALGRSTSDPSTASRRNVFFHNSAEANVASKRRLRCSQMFRQNARVSCFLAWQNASSVMQRRRSHGQATPNSPHARERPWVMDVVWRPTYIINHATTSGMSGRFRLGAHRPRLAASRNTEASRMSRNGANPNRWKISNAQARWEPILDMTKPPCQSRTMSGLPRPPLSTSSSTAGGFFI